MTTPNLKTFVKLKFKYSKVLRELKNFFVQVNYLSIFFSFLKNMKFVFQKTAILEIRSSVLVTGGNY